MKKTLVKSILLAIFGMMVVQNVNAQKISAGEEVATNIGPGLGAGEYFYYDNILYEVETVVSSGNYEAKAVSFYGESLPAEIEILGGGEANSCTFTVTEIEALNSVKTMSGTSYVEGDASALDAITTLIFVKEDGFGGFAGTIADGAIDNLPSVEYVYTYLTEVPEASEEAFWGISDNAKLIVPTGYMGKYGTAEGWQYFYIYVDPAGARFGDINSDGFVDINDVSALLEYQDFGEFENSDWVVNEESVDVDGNETEDINDVSALLTVLDYVGSDF